MKKVKCKKELIEWLVCFAFVFRQAPKAMPIDPSLAAMIASNLDPFYLLIIPFGFAVLKEKKVEKWLLMSFALLICWASIQMLLLPNIVFSMVIINLTKILICLSIMYFSKRLNYLIDYEKIVIKCSLVYLILLIYALIWGNNSNILWRLNDYVNVYDLKRLMLFYLEPSELGFHIALIIIFSFGIFLRERNLIKKLVFLGVVGINIVVLFFAKPMGAICVLAFSISIMFVIDFLINNTRQKIISVGIVTLGAMMTIGYMILNQSSIWLRVLDTINGTDASNAYRVGTANSVLASSIFDFWGLGCGYGNGDTPFFLEKYNLQQRLVNAYGTFVIEAGVLGAFLLFMLCGILVHKCVQMKNIIKWGFFAFLFVYQFVGGHFTSGLVWWIYGMILNTNLHGEKEKC